MHHYASKEERRLQVLPEPVYDHFIFKTTVTADDMVPVFKQLKLNGTPERMERIEHGPGLFIIGAYIFFAVQYNNGGGRA